MEGFGLGLRRVGFGVGQRVRGGVRFRISELPVKVRVRFGLGVGLELRLGRVGVRFGMRRAWIGVGGWRMFGLREN